MCDLHLPSDENALQYKILDWAIEDIYKKQADCIVYAGDVTCDGNIEVYKRFIEKMKNTGLPFLFIPGNSDLRSKDSLQEICKISSQCRNKVGGNLIFAVNDCENKISDEQFSILEKADDESIVFMHHPMATYPPSCQKRLSEWRKRHKGTMLFYGHRHISGRDGNDVSLQAMDPDKAIGECPCVTYFDTSARKIEKSYYYSPVPADLLECFGISCYKPLEQIDFAIKNNLKNLELRPNCIKTVRTELVKRIALWRESGGENLSIHLPDVFYKNGVAVSEFIDEYIELAKALKAQRLTQHVPNVSVKTVCEDKTALKKISRYLADKFNSLDGDVVIGVENMHMTPKEAPDENRRFGYTPEECLEFMQELSLSCKHKVGINFDIGHARNNAPYSQKYQISTWFSMIGKYIVGYHIHQVTSNEGEFENHMPITEVYGRLISYASFFKCWTDGQINKGPVVFEMRPEGAYEVTLRTFNKHR